MKRVLIPSLLPPILGTERDRSFPPPFASPTALLKNMSDPISIFWKRFQACGLLDPSRFEAVQKQAEAANLGDVKALAKWLIGQNVLTRFQAKTLLSSPKLPLAFSDYVVIDELADSPFAEAYRIKHVPTGHELMAVLHRASSFPALEQPASLARIQERLLNDRPIRQAQCAKAHEVIRKGDQVFVVSDLLQGPTLRTRLAQGKLATSEASAAAVQIALALAAWHESGVAHADLCPENVIFSSDGTVRLWHDPLHLPSPIQGADVATLRELERLAPYLAPELDIQQAPYSHLTDLYALGAVYFEMLAGTPALRRDSLVATLQAHATERIPELSAMGVPKPLEQIVTYLMAKRSDVRYQEATAVASQITQFSETPIEVPPPPVPLPAASAYEQWISRRPPLQIFLDAPAAAATPAGAAPGATVPVVATPGIATPGIPGFGGPASLSDPAAAGGSISHNSPQRLIEARRKARQKQRIIMAIAGVVVLIGSIVGAVVYFRGKPTETAQSGDGTGEQTTGTGENPAGPGESETEVVDSTAAVPQTVVDDDGKLLWESPTQGDPISLVGLPDNPKGLCIFRVASLLEGNSGISLRDSLGPDFDLWRTEWEGKLGVNLDQVDRAIVSLHDSAAAGQAYQSLIRIELAAAIDSAALKGRWEDAGFSEGSGNSWQSGEEALAVVDSEASGKVKAFVFGPTALVDLAVSKGSDSPVLSPDQRLLLPQLDGDRQVTLVFGVTQLFGPEGKAWLGSRWLPLAQAVEPVLLDGINAVAISAHRDGGWYLEATVTKKVGQTVEQLVAKWDSSVSNWGNQLEAGIAQVPQHPYWERVRLRYPTWFREGLSMIRFGVEGNVARANTWLPEQAGPNLVAGTELILASLSDPAVDTETPTGPPQTTPQNLDELLQAKVEFSVTSDDMINVMNQLQESLTATYPGLPFPFVIRLVGKDLSAEGITQNQRISNFSSTDQTLDEVLTRLVVIANPDKASASPRDEKQKLLWVVGPNPDNPEQMAILITTRKAAVRDMLELPEPFRPE